MGNRANGLLIKLIQQHKSPLCRDLENMSMFTINVDDTTSLGLFAKREKVLLQLSTKTNDAELTVTFNNFTAEESVDSVVFAYNAFAMRAYVDKRKARKKGSMVFGMSVAEDDNSMSKEIFEQLHPMMEHLCNLMVGMTLSVLSQVLEKEDIGISLSDFGYINFE